MQLLKNQMKTYCEAVSGLLAEPLASANNEHYDELKTHLESVKELIDDENNLLWPNVIEYFNLTIVSSFK